MHDFHPAITSMLIDTLQLCANPSTTNNKVAYCIMYVRK